MRFHIMFLLITLSIDGGHADNSSSTSSRLLEMVQDFCPGANICRTNQTTRAPFETFQLEGVSCCTECSCASDCEGDGNCCFPRSVPQQQFDLTASRTRGVCLFPTSVKPGFNHLFQSYYMISSVSEKSVDGITNTSCGDKKVAPWGSLHPVYSANSKRIYKNIACAADDGVEDGMLWDADLICTPDLELSTSNFFLGLNSNSVNDNCRVNFIFQGDSKIIRPLRCYIDIVDTCDGSEFQIPDDVDASKEEVIEACTSGLVSPYRGKKLYANVFCLICNAEKLWKDRSCRPLTDSTVRGSSGQSFIGLIDSSFITETRQGYLEGAPKHPRACPIQALKKNAGCRIIFCPSGQLRGRDGKCRYLTKLWFGQEYIVFINLTAEEYINIEEIFQVEPGGVSTTLPYFDSPWQNNWFVGSVYYEDFSENKNITHFFVILRNKISEIQPNRLIKNIKKMAIREWFLIHNNVTVVLKSSNMKFESLIYATNSTILIGNQSESIQKPSYKIVYNSGEMPGYEHLITKLYLCDQVELIQNEFILGLDKTTLFNTITTKFLFDGEFALIKSSSFEGVRARVCIEDSGLYSSDGQVAFSHGSSFFKKSIRLLVVAVLFLIVAY